MLDIADFFGATFIAFLLAIAEIVTISWIYGVNRICKDAEFMLGLKTGLYWRICWGLITPVFMGTVLVYYLYTLDWSNPIFIGKDTPFPVGYKIFGYCLTSLIVMQVPIWMIIAVVQQKSETLAGRVFQAFKPTADWGPRDPEMRSKYLAYLEEEKYYEGSLQCTMMKHGFAKGLTVYAKQKLFN